MFGSAIQLSGHKVICRQVDLRCKELQAEVQRWPRVQWFQVWIQGIVILCMCECINM